MRKTWIVVKNEVLRIATKLPFLISLILLPMLPVVVIGALSWFDDDSTAYSPQEILLPVVEPQKEGFVDGAGLIQEIPEAFSAYLISYPTDTQARAATDEGEIEGYYRFDEQYLESGIVEYYQSELNPVSTIKISAAMKTTIAYNLLDKNMLLLERLEEPAYVERNYLSTKPQRESTDFLTILIPYSSLAILLFNIMLSASFFLESFSDEQDNRILEILVLSVSPKELMLGKFIASGAIGLGQTALWSVIGLALLRVSGERWELSEAFQLSPNILMWSGVFFLMGYWVYAGLIACLGALVPDLKEKWQISLIVFSPLVIPLLLVSVLVQRPESWVSILLSCFPLTAPVAMMARMAIIDVAAWQILLSILLLIATGVMVVRLSVMLFTTRRLVATQSFAFRDIFWKLLRRVR